MRRHSYFELSVACIGVGLVALGFTYDDDELQLPISGLVRLDGRPLSTGVVLFTPVGDGPSTVRSAEWPKFGMVAFHSRVGTDSGLANTGSPYSPTARQEAAYAEQWLRKSRIGGHASNSSKVQQCADDARIRGRRPCDQGADH